MKNTNWIQQTAIFAMIAVITILSTYLIVDNKTNNISNDVVSKMLAIEYDKVGWMDNYVKINKIQKDQIIAWLKQLDEQWGWWDATPKANIPAPSANWATLSPEQAKQITSQETYVLWNPDADITWVEYSDLECPYCQKLHKAWTIEEVMTAYDWNVNFVFKQFPLNFHANAPKEAEAALCAWELGWADTYYSYIDAIFERTRWNGTGFALDALTPLALELWLDESMFKTCLDSGKYSSRVEAETAEWQTFGISWTPWNVLINNKTGKWDKLPWAYPTASFKEKIDSLLK